MSFDSVNCNVGVVVPAAGKSERFDLENRKQYMPIMGKPLIIHTLEAFLNLPFITKVCCVTDQLHRMTELAEEFSLETTKLIFAKGASSRHGSIKNGLISLKECGVELRVIVVHDGARPIVPIKVLLQVINGSQIFGAAGPVRPLTSTVLRPGEDGNLFSCLDRACHVASETPQAFLFPLIYDAYQKCSPEDMLHGTECLQLVLSYCEVRAKLIPSTEPLWKVTEKQDMYLAKACLTALSTKVYIKAEEMPPCYADRLVESLKSRASVVHSHKTDSSMRKGPIYNNVLCFHNAEPKFDLNESASTIIDMLHPKTPGIIIHLVRNQLEIPKKQTSEDFRNNRRLISYYEKLNKGVTMVHFNDTTTFTSLTTLITSLLFADNLIFTGQVFFL